MKRESTYMVVREGLIRGLENGKELARKNMRGDEPSSFGKAREGSCGWSIGKKGTETPKRLENWTESRACCCNSLFSLLLSKDHSHTDLPAASMCSHAWA